MNRIIHKKIFVSGVIATLSFLPGCTNVFNKSDTETTMTSKNAQDSAPMTGEVLMSIKGVPVITVDSLAQEKEMMIAINPGMKEAIAAIDPLIIDQQVFGTLIVPAILDEYVTSHNIDKTDEYQAELHYLCENSRRFLNAKYFTEQIAVTVSEAEIRNFYETNKDTMLKVSQGGIAALGIEFSDGAAARAFAARVKNSPGGFKKVAQDDGLNAKIKDFKLVNSQSIGIDGQLRDKITAIKTVPSVEIFEINGMFWVIDASAKEEPKYVLYEQIHDRIKDQLDQQKRSQANAEAIEKLKKEYAVEIDEEYFMPAERAEDNAQAMIHPAGHQAQDKEQRVA